MVHMHPIPTSFLHLFYVKAFKMYYAIGASMSSLHRESTDSLIPQAQHVIALSPFYASNIASSVVYLVLWSFRSALQKW